MSVHAKLLKVQANLKAPKGQYNSFGKYKYRSCEDILEAVKPLLVTNNASIVMSDEIVGVGDRIYVKATATFIDIENGESISNQAFARESVDKKGMDDSQITGTASSYARKYALNGLLLIDDTKDADTDEYHTTTKGEKVAKTEIPENVNPNAKVIINGSKVLVKGNSGWCDIVSLNTDVLRLLLDKQEYKAAHEAIRCELDVRSLKGEK